MRIKSCDFLTKILNNKSRGNCEIAKKFCKTSLGKVKRYSHYKYKQSF